MISDPTHNSSAIRKNNAAENWLESRRINSKSLNPDEIKRAWGSLALAYMLSPSLSSESEEKKAIEILKYLLRTEAELVIDVLNILYQGYGKPWSRLTWDNFRYAEAKVDGIPPCGWRFDEVIKKVFGSLESSNENFDTKINLVINILNLVLSKKAESNIDTNAAIVTNILQETLYSTEKKELKANWLEKIYQNLLHDKNKFELLIVLLVKSYGKSPQLMTEKILFGFLSKITDVDSLTTIVEKTLNFLAQYKDEHVLLAKSFILSFYLDRLNGQAFVLGKNKEKITKWCNELGKTKIPANNEQRGLTAIYSNSILSCYKSYYHENPHIADSDKKLSFQTQSFFSQKIDEVSLFFQKKLDNFSINGLNDLVKKLNNDLPQEIETIPTPAGWVKLLQESPAIDPKDEKLKALNEKIDKFWPKQINENAFSKEEEDNRPDFLSTEEQIYAASEIYLECKKLLNTKLAEEQKQKLQKLEDRCLNYLNIVLVTPKEKINPILIKNLSALHQIGWPCYPNPAPYMEEAKRELLKLLPLSKKIIDDSAYENIIASQDLSDEIKKINPAQCRQILYNAFKRALERGELLKPNNEKLRKEILPVIYEWFIECGKQNKKITLKEFDLSFIAQMEYILEEEKLTKPKLPLVNLCQSFIKHLVKLIENGEVSINSDELDNEFQKNYCKNQIINNDPQGNYKEIKYFDRRERATLQVFSHKGRAIKFENNGTQLIAKPYTTQMKKAYDMTNWQSSVTSAWGERLSNGHVEQSTSANPSTTQKTLINHCSNVAGAPVQCAGLENISSAGFYNGISSQSGHYKSAADNLAYSLTTMKEQDFDLSSTLIEIVNLKKLLKQQNMAEDLLNKKFEILDLDKGENGFVITPDHETKKLQNMTHKVCDQFTSQNVFAKFKDCSKLLYSEIIKLVNLIEALMQNLPENLYQAEKNQLQQLLDGLKLEIKNFKDNKYQILSKRFQEKIKLCLDTHKFKNTTDCHQLKMIGKILRFASSNLNKIDYVKTQPNLVPVKELDQHKQKFDEVIKKLYQLYKNACDEAGNHILPSWLILKNVNNNYSLKDMLEVFSDYLALSNYSPKDLYDRIRKDATVFKTKFDEVQINSGHFAKLQEASKQLIWSLFPAVNYFKWFYQDITPYNYEIVKEKIKSDSSQLKNIDPNNLETVDKLSFLANGDGGLENEAAKKVAKLMAEWILELRKKDPNTFVAWGGDNIYSDGVDDPESAKFDKVYYKQFEKWILDALSGSFFIAGNHDGKQYSGEYLLPHKSRGKTLPTKEVMARIWNQVIHTFLHKHHPGPIPPEEFYNQAKLLMSYVIENKWFWNFPNYYYQLRSKDVRMEMLLANTLAVDALDYLENLELIDKDYEDEVFDKKFKDLFFCTPINNQIYRLIDNAQKNPNDRVIIYLHNPLKTHSEKIDKPDTPYYIEETKFNRLKELLDKRIDHLYVTRWNNFVKSNMDTLKQLFVNLKLDIEGDSSNLEEILIKEFYSQANNATDAKTKIAKLQFLLLRLNIKIDPKEPKDDLEEKLINKIAQNEEQKRSLKEWSIKTKGFIHNFYNKDCEKTSISLLKKLSKFQDLKQWRQDLKELTYPNVVKNTLKIKTPNAMQYGDLEKLIFNIFEIPCDFAIAGHDHDMYLTEDQAVIGAAAKKPQKHKWFKRLLIFLTNLGSGYFEISKDKLSYQYKSIPDDPYNKDSLCQGKTWTFTKDLTNRDNALTWVERENIKETNPAHRQALQGFKQAIFKAYQDYIEIFRNQLKENKTDAESVADYITRKEQEFNKSKIPDHKTEDADQHSDQQFINCEVANFMEENKPQVKNEDKTLGERLNKFFESHGNEGIRRADDINGFLMCDELARMSFTDVFNAVDSRLHNKFKESKDQQKKETEFDTFIAFLKEKKNEAKISVKNQFNPSEHPFFMFVYVNLRYTEPFAEILKDIKLEKENKSLLLNDFKSVMNRLRESYGFGPSPALESFYGIPSKNKVELPEVNYESSRNSK